MRAFQIKKTMPEYDVLKAGMKMAKMAKDRKGLDHIHYNAEDKEIVASNGFGLIILKTELIEENLVMPKSGEVRLEGSYVILDEGNNSFANYKKIVSEFKAAKRANVGNLYTRNAQETVCHIIAELAMQGMYFTYRCLQFIADIGDYIQTIELQDIEGRKDIPVRFSGGTDEIELTFIALPAYYEKFNFMPVEEEETNAHTTCAKNRASEGGGIMKKD